MKAPTVSNKPNVKDNCDIGRVMRCEADWRETERRVAATAGHVECRKAAFSCLTSCEEGVSGNLTATVGGCSEVALTFLSVCPSVCLSVCLSVPNVHKNGTFRSTTPTSLSRLS